MSCEHRVLQADPESASPYVVPDPDGGMPIILIEVLVVCVDCGMRDTRVGSHDPRARKLAREDPRFYYEKTGADATYTLTPPKE